MAAPSREREAQCVGSRSFATGVPAALHPCGRERFHLRRSRAPELLLGGLVVVSASILAAGCSQSGGSYFNAPKPASSTAPGATTPVFTPPTPVTTGTQ